MRRELRRIGIAWGTSLLSLTDAGGMEFAALYQSIEQLPGARGAGAAFLRREIVVLGFNHRQRLFGTGDLVERGPYAGGRGDGVDETHAGHHRRFDARGE